MSAEKPGPGDVWEFEGHGHVLSHEFIIEVDETHALCSERTGVSCQRRLDHFRHGRWCTNVFDLLSGDPSAWAAALRFAPPEAVTAAFLAQAEAEGKGKELREGLRGEMWALPGHDGPQVLRWLNLSALLESEGGSEEGKPCEG